MNVENQVDMKEIGEKTKTHAISEMLNMGWWEMDLKEDTFVCSSTVAHLLSLPTKVTNIKTFTNRIREDYRARVVNTIRSASKESIIQLNFPVYISDKVIWVATRCRQLDEGNRIAGMLNVAERRDDDITGGENANEILQNFIYQLNGISRSLFSFLQNENLDDTVNHILASLVTHFSAERAYIFSYNEEAQEQSCIYEALSREELAEIQNLQDIPVGVNPWWTSQMHARKPIILSTLDDLPDEYPVEKEVLAAQSIKSLMVVPFVTQDNKVWGYAGIDLVDHQRNWTQEDFEWFSSLMHIINICIELGKSKTQIQSDIIELEEREKLLTTIYENLPVGMELYDKEGYLLYANDKDREILELNNDDNLVGCNVFEHPCLPPDVKRKMKRGEKTDFNINYDFSKVEGYFGRKFRLQEPKNLTVKTVPIFDKQQVIQNYLFIVIDNTETTNAYLKIQEFEEYFSLIANLAQIGYFKWDVNTREGFAIDQWFINLGQPADSVLTDDLVVLCKNLHPDDLGEVIDFHLKSIEGKAQIFEKEIRVIDPVDGHMKWLRWTLTVKRNDNNDHQEIIGVSFDITELKEMILAKNKAEALDRLKSAFLANMSHEIRTPLNSIIGFSDLLAETEDENERKEFISIIQRNNELLLKLVSDILDLSKIESGTFDFIKEKIKVHNLCTEVIQSFSNKELNNDVQLLFDPSLPEDSAYADPGRVKQILFNFMTNSIKFTHAGHIRLGYQSLSADEVLFYVEDTGKGIAPEDIGSVFDRFVKFDSFVQGTGLGLSICKSLVEEMGGTIGVDSVLGKGSRFWFTLPKHEA